MAEMVQVLAPDVEFQRRDDDGAARTRRGARRSSGCVTARTPSDRPHPRRPVGTCPPGERPSIRHFTSNSTIDFESETRARVRTYYAVLSSFGLDHWGRYLDEFGVVDGEWLDHQAHGHDRGRRSRRLGRGASA